MLMAASVGSDEMMFTGHWRDRPESEQDHVIPLQQTTQQAKAMGHPTVYKGLDSEPGRSNGTAYDFFAEPSETNQRHCSFVAMVYKDKHVERTSFVLWKHNCSSVKL